jgi:hypothetical protein
MPAPDKLLAVSSVSCCSASRGGVSDASGPTEASIVRTIAGCCMLAALPLLAAVAAASGSPLPAAAAAAAACCASKLLRWVVPTSSSLPSACRMRATTLLTLS